MAYEKGNGKTAVIALGGNALGNTPQEQLELVQNTAKHIVDMIQDGTNVVVSHGNGPQVGMINNAFAYAAANDDKTPDMPFPEAGAMSQGYIGYQLSQAILNDLKSRDIMRPRSTACIVTQTVVDETTRVSRTPPPVGAFMDEETAIQGAEMGHHRQGGRRQPRLAPGDRLSPVPSASWVRRRARPGGGRLRGRSTGGGGAGLRDRERLRRNPRAVVDTPLQRAHGRRAPCADMS